MHFKKYFYIALFFISASIIAVKGKSDMNKSLIMYVPDLAMHY